MEKKVGLLGLGIMGRIFAGHLTKAFGRLTVYDKDPDRLRRALPEGASPADSARGVGACSQIVVLALPSPQVVDEAVAGGEGILEGAGSGTLVVDLSTIDPFTCRRMYEAAARRGVQYLEAPVSGGEPGCAGMEGARAANITFMAAGDREAFEAARPIFEVLGRHWFFLGPPGTGAVVKLISNLVAGLNNLVAAEAFILGAAAGIPWQTLIEVFRHTDAKSYQMMDYMEPRLRRGDFTPGFSADLQYKDHRLAGELAQQLNIPLLLNALALQIYQSLRALGRGQNDFTDSMNLMAEWAGLDVLHPRPPFFREISSPGEDPPVTFRSSRG